MIFGHGRDDTATSATRGYFSNAKPIPANNSAGVVMADDDSQRHDENDHREHLRGGTVS